MYILYIHIRLPFSHCSTSISPRACAKPSGLSLHPRLCSFWETHIRQRQCDTVTKEILTKVVSK